MITIRVGDTWLHTIGGFEVEEVVDRWPGGPWSLSWTMNLDPGARPPALMEEGVLVQLYVGGGLRWSGRLGEPDWEQGQFFADGLCREGETALALGGSGPTTNPGEAIYFAAARNATSWGSLVVFTAITELPGTDLNNISALLDAYCDSLGRRWLVDEFAQLQVSADPTTPTIYITPGLSDLGTSTQTQVTDLFATYLHADTLKIERVSSPTSTAPRRIERSIDLSDLGPMTPAQAQGHVNGIMAKVGPQALLTGGIDVSYGQIVNANGTPLDLDRARAGQMARAQGVRDPRNDAPSTDFVVGESVWRPREGRLLLNPVEQVATDFAAVVEAIGGQVIA